MKVVSHRKAKSKEYIRNITNKKQAKVRATAKKGSFGTQKEDYGLRKIATNIKSTEILPIFFGIHIANVLHLDRGSRENVSCDL